MSNKLELLYAKIVFRLNTEKRMASCRKLSSLLRNDFTLMDALSRIERIESKGGAKPDEPFAIVMREWQKNLERGQSFSDATRGWVPMHETLLLTLGDISKLSIALENIGRVVEGIEKIKRSMLSAVAYPLFLLALTFGIIIMVGMYLVPPLVEAAGHDIVWRGTSASLVWVADFSKNYWYVFAGGFLAAVLLIWLSLPSWSGRLRAVFDSLPPWNMYKIQVSVGWLMSLSAMVAAGGTIPVALKMLADNSTKYLRSILESSLGFIANGDNLGVALANTGRNFPNDEIIGDLSIYADMNGFDTNLSKIADDYLDESVRKMDMLSNTVNSFGILLVSVIIGWVVFGTFQIQDQITAALT
ncbi:MAG: type II secretion system F family protein [Rickettsiales bacterium]|jgi:type II secretory pathway component PulF|nr:type II secretion system F family protein [Rickettsiales bacterium]